MKGSLHVSAVRARGRYVKDSLVVLRHSPQQSRSSYLHHTGRSRNMYKPILPSLGLTI
jgi:hypothetical protein